MVRLFFLLILIGICFSCPYYPYNDYVHAGDYHSPVEPSDTILDYCSFSLDTVCLLTNLLNTTEEKKLFIVEWIAENSFENIQSWNENISFGKWFNNRTSSTNIKDAWIIIAYIDPSVYYNRSYLVNDSSEIITKQNFTFVVDVRQLAGDCRSDFHICGYDYFIDIGNNGTEINATLHINSEYLVERYHRVRHCVSTMYGTYCWYSCDYYRTDSFRDSLTVSDSKKIGYHNFTLDSNYSLLNYYNGLAEILINTNNSNVHFQIGNSSFDKINYLYKIRYEKEPYNLLVKELIPTEKISYYGLSILERNETSFQVLAPYSENCSLTIYDHFYSQTISGCPISNFTNSSGSTEIEVEEPELLSSFARFLGIVVAFFIVYKIAKKVMRIA